jgi:cell division protein FtsQ
MNVFVRAGLGTLALAALGGGAWYAYDQASTQAIRSVSFSGDTARIAPADLERLAATVMALPPKDATLTAVRDAAKRVAWVREATARRRFPSGIEVRLEAYQPFARWTEGRLVTAQGEIFSAAYDGKLPRFSGPEGSAGEIAREYPALAAALAPLASPIAELKLSARGAWEVALDSGLVLELGRGDRIPRIERFVAAWPQISKDAAPKYADLRYPNGFALKRARDPNDSLVKPPAARKPARLTKTP